MDDPTSSSYSSDENENETKNIWNIGPIKEKQLWYKE